MGLRADVRAAMKILGKVEDNMLILLRYESRLATHEFIEAFIEAIDRTGATGVAIAVTEGMDDVVMLNEAEMNRLGWYRQDGEG